MAEERANKENLKNWQWEGDKNSKESDDDLNEFHGGQDGEKNAEVPDGIRPETPDDLSVDIANEDNDDTLEKSFLERESSLDGLSSNEQNQSKSSDNQPHRETNQ